MAVIGRPESDLFDFGPSKKSFRKKMLPKPPIILKNRPPSPSDLDFGAILVPLCLPFIIIFLEKGENHLNTAKQLKNK